MDPLIPIVKALVEADDQMEGAEIELHAIC